MVKGAVNSIDANAINPLAWVLGPVQNAIGDMLVPLRTVQHVLTWEESAATTFIYNALGVPIAAGLLYPFLGILLSPMIAAAAMSLSSVSVIANALRLRNADLDSA